LKVQLSRARITIAAAIALLTMAGAAGAAVVVLGWSAGGSSLTLHGDAIWPGSGRPAPAVRLRDSAGREVSLASFRGHVVMLAFLDSHCGQQCPVQASQMAAVDRGLPAADRPQIVVVSVNPADSRLSVARFVHKARWAGPWVWMTGTRSQLKPVWRKFGIQVLNTTRTIDGIKVPNIAHSSAIYLLDANGRERTGYASPFLPRLVIEDVRALESA
jgi:cytochrome oxidase Cu insertion factor (SCO1/SenC/PrrC family)